MLNSDRMIVAELSDPKILTHVLQSNMEIIYNFMLQVIMRPKAEWAIESRGHEGEKNNGFSEIQLVGQKYPDKTTQATKTVNQPPLFWFSEPALFTTSGL